jgi:CBS domain-containing protein
MLKGHTVPLPRREIGTAKLPGAGSATIPAPRAVESNAHVAAAAYLMKHADVTALAVVDGREPEQAIGVITAADVARAISDGMNVNDLRVYQLMRQKRAASNVIPRADNGLHGRTAFGN